jgi:uncharacterized protein
MLPHKTTRTPFLTRLGASDCLNVIFQLTDRCVLSCRYCFAAGSHRSNKSNDLISTELLGLAIRQSFNTRHKEVIFEWTGGEPFLAGIDFYRKAAELQKKYGTKNFHNTVQTSGYVYDEALIDFLVEKRFHISMTIDGPRDVHDFNRPASGNRPSLNRILKTRDYVVKTQGACGFICTVTQRNLGQESRTIKYFRSLGIKSFHSNPYIYFSRNLVKDRAIALTNKDYSTYFISQFQAWLKQGNVYPVPWTVDYIFQSLREKKGLSNTLCSFGGRCLTNFIAITPKGDAHLCPKFTAMEVMRLGNINDTTIAAILSENSPPMSKMINERISAINKCEKENCRYLMLCNGGCPYYSFIRSGGKSIREKDCLCSGKKTVYRYLETVLNTFGAP